MGVPHGPPLFAHAQSNDTDAKTLSENWMRAYLRGADRDQPAFACL